MKQIFLVEDDAGIREMIEFMLQRRHYKVRSFASGESFKKALKAKIPDLILLDIMLPDSNGLEICQELRKTSGMEHIPIILMSAHAESMAAGEVGAQDYIAKPFNVEDLSGKIDKLLQSPIGKD